VVSAAKILKYLTMLRRPAAGQVLASAAEVEAFAEGPGPVVIGCGIAQGTSAAAAFNATAHDTRAFYNVGAATAEVCSSAFPSMSFRRPAVLWFRGDGASPSPRAAVDARIIEDARAMKRWLASNKVLQEMTPDNSHVFLDSPEPLAIFLVNPRRQSAMSLADTLVGEVEGLVASRRAAGGAMRDFQFVWSDCKEFGDQFEVGRQCLQVPVVVLVNTATLDHKTLLVQDLLDRHAAGDSARADALLDWLGLMSKGWGPEKTERDKLEETQVDHTSEREAAGGNAHEGGNEAEDRFVDADKQLEPTADPSWFASAAEQVTFSADNPGLAFRAYSELLYHMAKLRDSFESTHGSHVSFDFSELEAVQRLHPNLRMLPRWQEIRAASRSRRAMRAVWRRVEAHAQISHELKSMGKGNATLREFGRLAAQGYDRLRKMFVALLETLHDADRRGRLATETHRMRSVDRRDASELSMSEFIERYATKGEPVIITGMTLTKQPWTLDFLSKACDARVMLKRKNTDRRTWGRLEKAGELSLAEFIATFTTNETRKSWYLHDWPLPLKCPGVLGPAPYEELTVPRYFAGDYFQRSGFSQYQHSWPSLFIGSELTESAMHIDSGETNFWMYLLSGRKEWRFYRRCDLINLYPSPKRAVHFFPDIFRPEHGHYPLLKYAELFEGTQEPGDLIFIPAGNPHGVRNLEPIHALSMNYVDGSNVWLHLEQALATGSFADFADFELFTDNASIPFGLRSDQQPLKFGEWKSQRWREVVFDLLA